MNISHSSHQIKKIAIIGLGKMGQWFAEKLKNMVIVAVYDLEQEKCFQVEKVIPLRKLTELTDFQPDLLLNSVNIQATIPVFEEIINYLPTDCLLADITSVKGNLPAYYRQSQRRFVSTHPMFGPGLTEINQLKKENAIIIKESDAAGKHFFREFYQCFKINIFEYSFSEHDEIIAYSLTVPFASSLVFAAHLSSSAVPGTTFKKHLAIARHLLQEDDYLLAEILFNPYSLPQLEKITQRLEFLKHIIRAKDYEEIIRFFKLLRENIAK
ncbi:prephenate dehydrogenase/arogenate dehydrogenase family protein [Candidatus Aminicenantes bacterium AC-334-K16]|jgi:prephenate dehydrogenase|nr:prephenate dehydrogenase/arogenate dehydrogenase family protein [Candidatus Aminicenantes bacterium AC-334-K16]